MAKRDDNHRLLTRAVLSSLARYSSNCLRSVIGELDHDGARDVHHAAEQEHRQEREREHERTHVQVRGMTMDMIMTMNIDVIMISGIATAASRWSPWSSRSSSRSSLPTTAPSSGGIKQAPRSRRGRSSRARVWRQASRVTPPRARAQ